MPRPQRRLLDYVIICVCYYSYTLLHVAHLFCIFQAHAADYIMHPHPCTAVEQNKGTLPAEAQQLRLMRRVERSNV